MTIPTPVARNNYIGTGLTSVYAYTFPILSASHLEVWTQGDELDDESELLVLNTDYTVSGVGTLSGGNVTLASPLADGFRLTIRRVIPMVQATSIRDNSQYFASIHENTFDYITMLLQQVQDVVSRTFHFQPTSTLTNVPISDIVADAVPVANATGDFILWTPKTAFRGETGAQGPQGIPGPTGLASRWYVQAGPPDPLVGVDTDMSLDSSNGDVYRKGAVTPDVWAIEANIAGPAGPAGFGDLNPSTLTPVGTTQTVNWGNGNFQRLDLSSAAGVVTLTLSSPSTGPSRYTMFIYQGAIPRELVWPSSVKWPQGQAPILSTTNGAIDKVELLWDGTNYFGDWNNDYQTAI